MKTVNESPEHHFLTMLDRLKKDPSGWIFHHYKLAEKLNHEDLVSDPSQIRHKLDALRNESSRHYQKLWDAADNLKNGLTYHFTDNDIFLLARASDKEEQNKIQSILAALKADIGADYCKSGIVEKEIYMLLKLSDKKFLSAKRLAAYNALSDHHKVKSLPLRRSRRGDPLILVVEDDRFSAAYTANILNKEYDMIHCKTGEEAIMAYIENAPDMAFIDIHLPGLSGHETLQAIKKIDPQAFVIMLSVDAVRTNVVSASTNGAMGFLKKPFTKEKLLGAVRKGPNMRPGRFRTSSESSTTTH